MLLIGKCNRAYKGQLARHVCVSGQNASCERAVVSHFAELTVVVVVFNKIVRPMSSFFTKFCHVCD